LPGKTNYDKQKSQAAAGPGFSGDRAGFRCPRRRLSLQIPGQPGQGFAGAIEWSRDGEMEAGMLHLSNTDEAITPET
jgi:hypothetical protein